MGARAAKQRAATRSAKKRKLTSKSLAITGGTAECNSAAPMGEEKAGELTEPSSKLMSLGEKKVQAAPVRTTQGTSQVCTTKTSPPEVEQDSAKNTPDDDVKEIPNPNPVSSVRPERQARGRFLSMLAEIAEEPKIHDADRTIGGSELPDDKWDLWKAGPGERDDEFEDSDSDSESDETRSIASTMTAARTATKLLSRNGALPTKPCTKKTKAAGKSKRKYKDLDPESQSDDSDDTEPRRECSLKVLLLLNTYFSRDRFHVPD